MKHTFDLPYHAFISVGNRGIASDDSKIVFNIPVHVMNLDNIFTEVKRDIAIALYIGDSKMWAGYQEVTIKPTIADVSGSLGTLAVKSATLLNNGAISVGDGVVYRVVMTAQQGWSNFDVELTGDTGTQN